MIGVKARPEQSWEVEEFFQLFKTPWEFYRSDHVYDVVIVTSSDVPSIDNGLLLLYQAGTLELDERLGVSLIQRRSFGSLKCGSNKVPIYAGLATFNVEPENRVQAEDMNGGAAAASIGASPVRVVRFGYDLFEEVQFLLAQGQPLENASIPTLDLHVKMLRELILDSGIAIAEIPPIPADHAFTVCLTHDIDFIGIRRHFLDHSMWGFIYRATVGSLSRLFAKRLTVSQVLRNWIAVASLPLVYMKLVPDFWEPFDWYLDVEKGLPSTYFLIPVKRHPGDKVSGSRKKRRAAAYDVTDMPGAAKKLLDHGCELGVHGIDAWNSAERGKFEAQRVAASTGQIPGGVRMHWLLFEKESPATLENAGFSYDSTIGYNETIGYRAGTNQVFRPIGAKDLLELPMHIQDGALFYPQRLNLSAKDASDACDCIVDHAKENGGMVTLLWHDRSPGPERFWGGFYKGLVENLKSADAWFGTCGQVSEWFRIRRGVKFEIMGNENCRRVRMQSTAGAVNPGMRIRIHKADRSSCTRTAEKRDYVDTCWDGRTEQEIWLDL